jgi:hypothetical protein
LVRSVRVERIWPMGVRVIVSDVSASLFSAE